MDVIGHDNVTADSDILNLRPLAELSERLMDFTTRENSLASMSIEGHKIKWPDGRE
jgi:hypothetical protein